MRVDAESETFLLESHTFNLADYYISSILFSGQGTEFSIQIYYRILEIILNPATFEASRLQFTKHIYNDPDVSKQFKSDLW